MQKPRNTRPLRIAIASMTVASTEVGTHLPVNQPFTRFAELREREPRVEQEVAGGNQGEQRGEHHEHDADEVHGLVEQIEAHRRARAEAEEERDGDEPDGRAGQPLDARQESAATGFDAAVRNRADASPPPAERTERAEAGRQHGAPR